MKVLGRGYHHLYIYIHMYIYMQYTVHLSIYYIYVCVWAVRAILKFKRQSWRSSVMSPPACRAAATIWQNRQVDQGLFGTTTAKREKEKSGHAPDTKSSHVNVKAYFSGLARFALYTWRWCQCGALAALLIHQRMTCRWKVSTNVSKLNC